jgi:putative heme-binding domain-containing protein
VFAASGPDGALYVADFCRRWVEHPDFVRPERRAGVVWDEGRDRGRIWRVRPVGRDLRPVPRLDVLAPSALVAELRSPVGWVRGTALRLLGECPVETIRTALEALPAVAEPPVPETRASLLAARHAAGLPPGPARQDADPRVRRLAARLERAAAGAAPAAADPDAGVRFEEVLAAEGATAPQRGAFLLAALLADPADPWVDAAAACVAADAAPGLVAALAATPGTDRARRALLVRSLAATCAADDAASRALSAALGGVADEEDALEILAGWLRARRAAGTPLGADFGGSPWESWFGRARAAAAGGDRGAAITILAADPSAPSTRALVGVVAAPAGAEEAAAAIVALRGRDDPAVAEAILAAWPTATPAVRRELLDGLLARPDRVEALLEALRDGRVAAPDIDPESRARLGAALAARPDAASLLGPGAAADRRGIVAAAEASLPATGSVDRGHDLFGRHCAGCHRAGATGARVGPDLGGVGSKERGQLLEDILDPNRSVTGEYAAVTILTHDGVAITGLPAGETPLTVGLRRQGGAVEEVARRDIESLRGTGRSLMPEGFEEVLAPADLADLIAFLRGRP